VRILNQTRNTVLADNAILANTVISGMVGLLKHRSLPDGEGMLITPCRSIHMFFMKFAIDVVFINRKNIVVGLVRNIQPFRISPYFWRASAGIELPPGTIDKTKTQLGDQINY
jgi:hypothetical protein